MIKRILGTCAVTTLVAIPLFAGSATTISAAPADYRAECETAYQAGKPVFDPLIANAKPATHAIEAALCGENRHS